MHPCAERLARHISWHLEDRVTLTDVRVLLEGYAAYHHLSLRTAWTDWGRLVEAGWLAPTRAPANQGQGHPQGPGSGRAARYVLTAPAAVITQLQPRASREQPTALDSFSSLEVSPSPSVPPPRHDHQGEWITLHRPTPIERRDASALLAGGQERWRRQRRDSELLTRQDWERLLPLAAEAQRQRPDVDLSGLLTDRVASARSLPAVLGWRLWRVLRGPDRAGEDAPDRHLRVVRPDRASEGIDDQHQHQQHLQTVRAVGGPAAVRAALTTACSHPAR